MIEFIFIILLLISLVMILYLLYHKIPVLINLPIKPAKKKKSIKKPFVNFSFKKVLHKTLSSIRVLTLKIENKTSVWLQRLRTEKKEKDNYWQNLKK